MDFERWFQQQGRPTAPPPSAPVVDVELPEGLWEDRHGTLLYICRSCQQEREWYATPEEFDKDMGYCGGSPSCIP